MSGRGGKREGAGRKPGSRTKFTESVRRKALADGVTPLAVMLAVMRRHWTIATTEAVPNSKERKTKPEADWDPKELGLALDAAQAAAPFCHPRLSTHEVGGKGGGGIPLTVSGSVSVYLPDNGRAGPRAAARA